MNTRKSVIRLKIRKHCLNFFVCCACEWVIEMLRGDGKGKSNESERLILGKRKGKEGLGKGRK